MQVAIPVPAPVGSSTSRLLSTIILRPIKGGLAIVGERQTSLDGSELETDAFPAPIEPNDLRKNCSHTIPGLLPIITKALENYRGPPPKK